MHLQRAFQVISGINHFLLKTYTAAAATSMYLFISFQGALEQVRMSLKAGLINPTTVTTGCIQAKPLEYFGKQHSVVTPARSLRLSSPAVQIAP